MAIAQRLASRTVSSHAQAAGRLHIGNPNYEGERDHRELLDTMDAQGFVPCLFISGYFERTLAKQLEIDGVFMRPGAAPPAAPEKPA